MVPGKGAQMARSAGAGVQLMARRCAYAQVRLRSGVKCAACDVECRATGGESATKSKPAIDRQGRRQAWRGIARPFVAWR